MKPGPEPAETGGVSDPLSDLLRLKRAERPAPDFWGGFERNFERRLGRSLIASRAGVANRILRWSVASSGIGFGLWIAVSNPGLSAPTGTTLEGPARVAESRTLPRDAETSFLIDTLSLDSGASEAVTVEARFSAPEARSGSATFVTETFSGPARGQTPARFYH